MGQSARKSAVRNRDTLIQKMDRRHHFIVIFTVLVLLGFHQAVLEQQSQTQLRQENMMLKQQVWEQHMPKGLLTAEEE